MGRDARSAVKFVALAAGVWTHHSGSTIRAMPESGAWQWTAYDNEHGVIGEGIAATAKDAKRACAAELVLANHWCRHCRRVRVAMQDIVMMEEAP